MHVVFTRGRGTLDVYFTGQQGARPTGGYRQQCPVPLRGYQRRDVTGTFLRVATAEETKRDTVSVVTFGWELPLEMPI